MSPVGNRKRLGRGLEALLGPTHAPAGADGAADGEQRGELTRLALDSIDPNPYQPRGAMDEAALGELQESLRSSGLLQPIVVRHAGDQRYQLIAGERRWRAAERLGWSEINAIVRDVDDRTLLTLALVENLQRDALSPMDEARGYRRLIEEFGLSQPEVGEMVGRDRSTVSNALRLLKLPEQVQQMLHEGKLSTGHARALLQLDDTASILSLAATALGEQLSVRELEARARGDRSPEKRARRGRTPRRPSPEVRRIEDALRGHLQTDVFVTARSKESGRITVNFYSNDDLARILGLILGAPFDG